VLTAPERKDFAVTRFGVVMSSLEGDPREAWGVLNPGGVRSPDGALHLFPRLIAEGNFSRIGHVRVRFEGETPVGVERLGMALEPREPYEVGPSGGGVEDARVVYVPAIKCYLMTYTAFVPYEPRVAIAVSTDLQVWRRLGLVHFEATSDGPDLNLSSNKDAAFFPEVIRDPSGVPSLGMLHRPTTRVHFRSCGSSVTAPPSGEEMLERIWISYVPIDAVLADIARLTRVRRHERVMASVEPWEVQKIGAGAPPVRLPYGWVLPYHAVSVLNGQIRYCMGIAILDLDRPSHVLYRTPHPILEPQAEYERNGLVNNVVFPTASDLRPDRLLDVYYGAADHVIAAARITLPNQLPTREFE
jgi:beta-1,2-mannobiose phosphorylase / 1,2-beta-oligomannan phosphorylase